MEYRNAPKSKLEFDPSQKCVKCGNNVIKILLDNSILVDDWICEACETPQLTYLKANGYRLYAFLLEGSWTSENFYAKSHIQAYNEACKKYGKDKVLTSYLRGAVDCYVMDGFISFNLYN